jgi:DNA topoisomerase VI subunit A
MKQKEVLVNEILMKKLLEESRQLEIMTKRYNFVVDLLDEDQQRTLRQWYIDTGVIQEEE